ncbi:MAG: class I SAM-dependent methyltransferase [Acidimicrobiales bacterium]
MDDERRLSFGEDAEQYDRARPSYPEAVIDAVCEGAEVRRVLDVGCGTGIASQLFLDRGCEVVGVEPDERMAAVARRRGVGVVVAPFEAFSPPAEPFDVVASAQAWHWVDQEVGPARAANALRRGGRLALISNGYERGEIRDELTAVYRRHSPQLLAKTFVLGRPARSLRAAHADPIEACGRFGPVEERSFTWERTYTRDEWLDQLPTHSDHRTLPPAVLGRLLEGIGAVIDANGGVLTIGHTTELLLAVARPDRQP